MIRFLHTADWQLGLKVRYVPGDEGADLRAVRFEAVRRLAALARDREVSAVVVAGDVFDDNAVGERTLQRAREALEAFSPIPVLLLPGNHDPATPRGALSRLDAGEHVRVLLDTEPVDVRGARFYPCPLRHRHERDDPTSGLPDRDTERPIRIAIAHGGILDFDEGATAPNRIDADRVLARGFDYLALGDWHGTLSFGPRVWYAGTPEQTRFKENDAGNALIVEIDEPGAEPRVEKVGVSRTHWLRHLETLSDDDDVARLERWLYELSPLAEGAERSMTLVELEVEGTVSLDARARVQAALESARGRLLFLRDDTTRLFATPTEADLAELQTEGFVGEAVAQLAKEPGVEASDALGLLYRFAKELRGGEP